MRAHCLAAVAGLAFFAVPSSAQERVPDDFDLEEYRDVRAPQADCGEANSGSGSPGGAIVVCGRRDRTEEYRSAVRRPVQSDKREIEGLTDNSCASGCVRMGWAPEPAIMVDVTAFPEELDEETATAVSRADER